ncbi:DNA double-strand break repair Rad50 ATPase, putative [Entamoeba dispar SAW760]|uniref:DNA double-strand break repair Rad50 ATPase, putative n=1 Tax=Entamoeba dispar (strain ATCC PRA-260 / SAW760) TaxID=370354 RepID=B0EAX3_ENTDS|nr:DNA double-strand break repair Rad50 ATPase, putative [Entamoeba dispar SAW760]EDR28315.1 DNA double-strand break repair Rad50 ATPase, putative [Entamoeba dispar SAW760]|eukprot:EDR28315.1 DNA double-strand break repair Rad50 ATPase, putative [Entamoeba dispar SAW760]
MEQRKTHRKTPKGLYISRKKLVNTSPKDSKWNKLEELRKEYQKAKTDINKRQASIVVISGKDLEKQRKEKKEKKIKTQKNKEKEGRKKRNINNTNAKCISQELYDKIEEEEEKKKYIVSSLAMYNLGEYFSNKQETLIPKIRRSRHNKGRKDKEINKDNIEEIMNKYKEIKGFTPYVKKSISEIIEKGKKYGVNEEIIIKVIMKNCGSYFVKNLGRRCSKYIRKMKEKEEEMFKEINETYQKKEKEIIIQEKLGKYFKFKKNYNNLEIVIKKLKSAVEFLNKPENVVRKFGKVREYEESKNEIDESIKRNIENIIKEKEEEIKEMEKAIKEYWKENEEENLENYIEFKNYNIIGIRKRERIENKEDIDIKKNIYKKIKEGKEKIKDICKEYNMKKEIGIEEDIIEYGFAKGEVVTLTYKYPKEVNEIIDKAYSYFEQKQKINKYGNLARKEKIEEMKRKVICITFSTNEKTKEFEKYSKVVGIKLTKKCCFSYPGKIQSIVGLYLCKEIENKFNKNKYHSWRTLFDSCYVSSNNITYLLFDKYCNRLRRIINERYSNIDDITKGTAYISSNTVINEVIKKYPMSKLEEAWDKNQLENLVDEVRKPLVDRRIEEMKVEINSHVDINTLLGEENETENEEDSYSSDYSM